MHVLVGGHMLKPVMRFLFPTQTGSPEGTPVWIFSSFRSNFCFLSLAAVCHWKHWWPHFHVTASLGKRTMFCDFVWLCVCVRACVCRVRRVSFQVLLFALSFADGAAAIKLCPSKCVEIAQKAEVLASNRPVLLCRPKAAWDTQRKYVVSFPQGLNLHLSHSNLSTSATILWIMSVMSIAVAKLASDSFTSPQFQVCCLYRNIYYFFVCSQLGFGCFTNRFFKKFIFI